MSTFKNAETDALSFDKLVNTNDGAVPTRYGGNKPSYPYLVDQWNQQIDEAIEEMKTSRGFRVVGDFATGFTYELPNDVGLDDDGNAWIYSDLTELPFDVSADTTPSSPDYTQVTFNSADSISNANGGSVQDALNSTYIIASRGDVSGFDSDLGLNYSLLDEPKLDYYISNSSSIDNLGSFDVGNGKSLVTSYGKLEKNLTSGLESSGTYDLNYQKYILAGVDEPTLKFGSGSGQSVGVKVSNFVAEGDAVQPTNNQAVVTGSSLKDSILNNFVVSQGYNSIGLEYGDIVVGERRSGSTHINNAIAKGGYIGYEMFSPYTSMLRGIADRNGEVRGSQHGLRITGYGIDHLGQGNDLRNIGNTYDVVVNNYANALSIQLGAYGNEISVAGYNCEYGITSTLDTSEPDAISSSNNMSFSVSDTDQDGGRLNNPLCSVFTGVVIGCGNYSFYTIKSPTRLAGHNVYNLTLRDALATRFEDSFSIINVTSKEINTGAQITGSKNIINMTFDDINNQSGTSPCATISGNDNIANVVAGNLNQVSSSQFNVTGDRNVITVNVNQEASEYLEVIVSGTKNIVSGNCKIDTSASNKDNDFSGVYGWSQQGGESVTTDAVGRATITVDTPVGTYFVDCNNRNFTNHYNICITGRTATNFTIIAYNQDGSIATSVALDLLYKIDCYID